MNYRFRFNERRKYPRVSVDLPLEFQESDNSPLEGGLVNNLSERGMLIHSIKDIPVGSKFKTVVFFSNEFEFDGFGVIAKVVWKDLHFEPDWKGHKYGLQFVEILEEDHRKLLNLLGSTLLSEGISVRKST